MNIITKEKLCKWKITVFWRWHKSLWAFATCRGYTKSAPYRIVEIGPLFLQWTNESKRCEYDFDAGKYVTGFNK